MRNPFCLIKVQSEGAKRLAWVGSVIASTYVLIVVGYTAIEEKAFQHEMATVLIVGAVLTLVTFLGVGYFITAIAWVVEGFCKKKSN